MISLCRSVETNEKRTAESDLKLSLSRLVLRSISCCVVMRARDCYTVFVDSFGAGLRLTICRSVGFLYCSSPQTTGKYSSSLPQNKVVFIANKSGLKLKSG